MLDGRRTSVPRPRRPEIAHVACAHAHSLPFLLLRRFIVQTHPSTTIAGSTADTEADPIIELHNVHFSYAGAGEEALRGVTLSVAAGEHLCVLGSNGSGKSTLAQLINALLAPTDGSARVCGIDAAAQPERTLELRRQVAMVFQHPDDQMVTSVVADDVAFGPENLGVPQSQIAVCVEEALGAVDMLDYAQADPADLSGGQRQRIAIAGALAMHPRVLVLDEPAAMLDVAGRRAIQRITRDFNERGITIVHITHFMDDALIAGRVVVMDRGRIALEGTPEEVFAQRDAIHSLGLEPPFTLQLAHRLEAVLPEPPAASDAEELARAIAHAATANTSTRSGAPRPTMPARSGAHRTTAPARSGGNCTFGSDFPPENSHFTHEREQEAQTATPNAAQTAAIEFRDVTFRYPDGGEDVLSHFSLKIPAGTTVAIVGETGAGKSTLVNLACRFFEPTSGQILIDGRDYRERSQLWLHSNIGYVLQNPHLFSGTIRENIRYGRLDATDAEVEAAARTVSADQVAAKLEKGWDSDVGEGGDRLSTGEKQLISFARAVLANPRIFVLDEATSSIDTQTEQLIQNAIDHLLRDRTSFLIAHRLSTIRKADLILVVRDGRIVEQGRHLELLQKGGYYHDLYTRQFAEESAARILK